MPNNTTNAITLGYKATDKDIKCRGFQFTPGVWHEVEGDLIECKNGFHYCEQPSGPWAYYSEEGARVWKIEAKEVLDSAWTCGADRKRVARFIRLVEEIILDGDRNTGYGNTGNRNTGDGNTGDRNTGNGNTGDGNTGNGNTGDGNTGYGNTGDRNTGDRNTGDRNTGDGNTGDRNTGDRNTGDGNTGYGNTGDGNTGYGNTGDRNTGDGNCTNRSNGFFCFAEPTVPSFGVDSGLTYDQYQDKFGRLAYDLQVACQQDDAISFDRFVKLPCITPERLTALHDAFKAARAKAA